MAVRNFPSNTNSDHYLVIGANVGLGTFKTTFSNKEVLYQNGNLTSGNIKGYMTLNDVSREFNISTEVLIEKCNLPNY